MENVYIVVSCVHFPFGDLDFDPPIETCIEDFYGLIADIMAVND